MGILKVSLTQIQITCCFFVLNNKRISQDERFLEVWNNCQDEGPLWSQSFDGVPYVWICPVPSQEFDAQAADQPLEVRFGEHIKLLGYDLSSTRMEAGQPLTLTLYWQSDGLLPEDYHVFVHLTDTDGQLMAQHDGVPVNGERATWSWRAGELIIDAHTVVIPENIEGDTYSLSAGMYDFETLSRLPLFDSAGEPLLEDHMTIANILTLISSGSK